MMREGLGANVRNVLTSISSSTGAAFQQRATAGGATVNNVASGIASPYWVRLVRSGNTFTAYRSPDGVTWTLAGTETPALSAALQVGLAASSHNNAVPGSATFDNLMLPSGIRECFS